jgi:hypothetical protein
MSSSFYRMTQQGNNSLLSMFLYQEHVLKIHDGYYLSFFIYCQYGNWKLEKIKIFNMKFSTWK